MSDQSMRLTALVVATNAFVIYTLGFGSYFFTMINVDVYFKVGKILTATFLAMFVIIIPWIQVTVQGRHSVCNLSHTQEGDHKKQQRQNIKFRKTHDEM
jgi:uncharacterized membrane protein YjgN (DUF898 family)